MPFDAKYLPEHLRLQLLKEVELVGHLNVAEGLSTLMSCHLDPFAAQRTYVIDPI